MQPFDPKRPYRITLTDSHGNLAVFNLTTGIDAERLWQAVRVASDASAGLMQHYNATANEFRCVGSFHKAPPR